MKLFIFVVVLVHFKLCKSHLHHKLNNWNLIHKNEITISNKTRKPDASKSLLLQTLDHEVCKLLNKFVK